LHVWETGCAQPVEQVRPPTHAAKPTAASGVGVVATCRASNALICASHHVAVQPAAARQLVAILGTLSKRTERHGKLALVKSMTASSPSA
jgi:hypothetical protein